MSLYPLLSLLYYEWLNSSYLSEKSPKNSLDANLHDVIHSLINLAGCSTPQEARRQEEQQQQQRLQQRQWRGEQGERKAQEWPEEQGQQGEEGLGAPERQQGGDSIDFKIIWKNSPKNGPHKITQTAKKKSVELPLNTNSKKIKVLLPEEDSGEEEGDNDYCGEEPVAQKKGKPLIKCEHPVCNLIFLFTFY